MLNNLYRDLVHEDGDFWISKERGWFVVLRFIPSRNLSVELEHMRERVGLAAAIARCSAFASGTQQVAA